MSGFRSSGWRGAAFWKRSRNLLTRIRRRKWLAGNCRFSGLRRRERIGGIGGSCLWSRDLLRV